MSSGIIENKPNFNVFLPANAKQVTFLCNESCYKYNILPASNDVKYAIIRMKTKTRGDYERTLNST